ncbi:MAG TPA: DNA ligase D [Bacteroidia bacterium]|jgi:bifunctional non-homologous end joining protein LigD
MEVKARRTKRNLLLKKGDHTRSVETILSRAPRSKMPQRLVPMLATLVDRPFDEPGWVYEVKWDGYRALAFCNGMDVNLLSRNEKSFNDKFYPLIEELEKWDVRAVVDGEVVVLDENGVSSFGALQNWRSEADGELVFYVFDVLWYDGKDLLGVPLTERKKVLEAILPKGGNIRLSNYFETSATEFFEAAKRIGLEGVIAKRANSTYHPGVRTREWLKIKANKRQEMVIGGFTVNDDSDKLFSALLVGTFENGKLVYAGKVGTGFNRKMQAEMMKLFKPLIIQKPSFTTTPDINKPSRFRPDPPHATATWLKPRLVCEVSYTEITSDGILRHPSFEGMRTDKNAKDVTLESAEPLPGALSGIEVSGQPLLSRGKKRERKTFLNPHEETQVREVNGHSLKFTNLSKYYWPKERITKRELLNYYYRVAPYILPYLKDRPQSMLRHPEGITGFSFYYKNVKGKAPSWIETYKYYSEADRDEKEYLVAKDDASLLYMVSLGCIEMNPWSSRVQSEDRPDWCIIDLDPGKQTTFAQVIQTAQVTHEILDDFKIPSYPKTSGSTGIHIYIPLGAKYTYEQSKEFARVIARMVNEALPAFTSIERAVKDRNGKLYVDFLQNRPQATVSAPYSVRPKPGAPVSMPLHWDEVKKGLKMTDFNIHNALERIKSEGDLFKPVLGKGTDLERFVKQVSK